MSTQEDLLSGEQAREFLGVSRTTLHRLLTTGELKGLKAGGQWRFRREDLVAYTERRPAGMAVGAISQLEDELLFWQGLFSTEDIPLEIETGTADERLAGLASGIISLAVVQGCSDIHFDPAAEQSRIRFRSDGLLREIRLLPTPLVEALIANYKGLSSMNLDEKHQPQDGRIRIKFRDKSLMVHTSTMPTVAGEALTLRLLMESNIPALNDFSSRPEELQPLRDFLTQPYGLMVIGGPAGSGKTSTAYALITELADSARKIVSIEDPAEIRLEGVQQTNVNRRLNLGFAPLLRAALRNDPDVIFASDIPDGDTADVIARAPLTGHLVFANISSTSAAEAISTLIQMGAEPSALNGGLRTVVGQRLVRRLCRHCAKPTAAPRLDFLSADEKEIVEASIQDDKWLEAVGCPHCRETGYRGRIPLFEVLEVQGPIREAISRRAPAAEIHGLAVASGMLPLAGDGLRKAARGETTVTEVLRVLQG